MLLNRNRRRRGATLRIDLGQNVRILDRCELRQVKMATLDPNQRRNPPPT
jgi:hypothetical protein